jgi:hypothetical protein
MSCLSHLRLSYSALPARGAQLRTFYSRWLFIFAVIGRRWQKRSLRPKSLLRQFHQVNGRERGGIRIEAECDTRLMHLRIDWTLEHCGIASVMCRRRVSKTKSVSAELIVTRTFLCRTNHERQGAVAADCPPANHSAGRTRVSALSAIHPGLREGNTVDTSGIFYKAVFPLLASEIDHSPTLSSGRKKAWPAAAARKAPIRLSRSWRSQQFLPQYYEWDHLSLHF